MKTETYVCQGCGVDVVRPVVRGQRPKWCPDCRSRGIRTNARCKVCNVYISGRSSAYCSRVCFNYDKHGPRFCQWPRPEPRPVAPPKPPPFQPVQRQCNWCGREFTATQDGHHFCDVDCKHKAKRMRRRAKLSGAGGVYTWAEVMRLFLIFGRCCAYCGKQVDGQPDPDHVVPLSRGGSNSITNILPCCRLCNCDKRDLLLAEWAVDRRRRGLSPVMTEWVPTDPRFRHLVPSGAA